MLNVNALLTEQAKLVVGLAPIAPSTSTPDYVSLKGYPKCAVVIIADNGATVTGSAITLLQATSVAAGSEKALAFTKVYQNIDTGAADTLAETAVVSNTFTTSTVDNKNLLYVIEVNEADLDINGGFDCIRAGTADAANTVLSVLYVLWPAKYGKNQPVPSAITD
jgi:hypothetical protein